MAANSGGNGVDWSSILESLSPTTSRTYSKTDLMELARAIRRSETLISNCNPEYKYFFAGLGMIAIEVFAASVLTLTSPQVLEVSKATDIIVGFLCQEIRREFYADPMEQILTCRRILETCQILCTLDTSNVDLEDRESLIKILRKSCVPEDDRYLLPDVSRTLSRFDQSSHIFDQLITPQLDVLEEKVEVQDTADNKPSQNSSTPGFQPDIKTYYTQRNLFTLRSLGIGEILLDVCLSLPYISRHATKVRDSFSKNTVPPPLIANDALGFRLSIHSIDRDMTLLNNTLKLPLVEPLIPNKLEKLALLSMTSLYLAVATSTSSTICGIAMLSMPKVPAASGSKLNEDESVTDRHAISLVEKALDMFNHVSWTLMQSATTGAPTSQNHLMMAGMVLLSGLQSQLQAASNCTVTKDDRGKSPSRKSFEKFNIMKVQHGFNVLSVAIASTLLKVLSDLMDALKVECMQQNKAPEVGPIKVDIMGNFTSFQRVMRVLQVTPIIPFFLNLITICYRKASALKREKNCSGGGGGIACSSDGVSFFEDDFTCTEVVRVAKEESAPEEETREQPTRDDSSVDDTFKDEDEDSEPILGLWLEETLAPELYITTAMDSPIKNQTSSGIGGICSANNFKPSVIPDKGQEAFISLASMIIKFINNYLINCDTLDVLVRHLQTSIGDQQIVLLCGIIKDLDRESSKSHVQGEEEVPLAVIRLDNIYNKFSRYISQFIHNLLTNKILNENLQKQLLNHLVKDHDTNTWPLQLYSRSLAVVSQIVMLKPLPERTTTTVTLWKRLINTLLDNVSFAKKSFDVDREDLNIEHVYVLLYMYHALNLIPRKSVMLMTGSALVRCSELIGCAMSDMQILYLSRLLLLFEYQLRHLYEIPLVVLEQSEWVLFVAPKIIRDTDHTFLSAEVEASYRKSWNQQDSSLCPRFYYISSPDAGNPEIPKIDGLACKFILGSAPKWKYQLLFDALIEILNIANQLNPTTRIRSLSFVGRCAVQYAFTICWRILQMLPPSIEYLETLSKDVDRCSSAYVLHTLFWGPRTGSKNFSVWIKECLIKQGADFQVPDNLVQSVNETVKTVMYDMFVVKKCIARFAPHINCWKDLVDEIDLPKITDIIVLDLLVCKLRVTIDGRLGPDDEIICNHIEDDELRGCDLAEDLMPHFCRLLDIVIASIRSCLLSQIGKLLCEADGEYVKEIDVIWHLLFISSHKMLFNISLVQALQALIPPSVIKFMEKWNEEPMENSHIRYNNDAIPTDGYLSEILNYHISGLSCDNICSVAYSLKMLLTSIVKFIDDYVVKFPPRDLRKRTVEYLVALSLDLSTYFVSAHTVSALETLVGEFDNEDYVKPAFYTIIERFFKLIERFKTRVRLNLPITSSDHKVLFECLKFMETILEKPYANMALYNFLNKSTTVKLLDILLLYPASKGIFDPRYANMSLRVLNKLAYHEKLYDYIPTVKMYRIEMISELSQLKNVDNSVLCGWLSQLVFGSYNFTPSTTTNSGSDESKVPPAGTKSTESKNAGGDASVTEVERNLLKENISLLQSLASFMVKEENNIDENAPLAILRALIIISNKLLEPPLDGAGFVELMSVMKTLAESSSGCGYVLLFKPATEWLKTCYNYLHFWEVEVVLQREQYPAKHRAMCDAACTLMSYIGGIFEALSSSSHDRQAQSSWDDEMTSDRESDLVEDLDAEDEESDEDDSDEDSLCNRLCTFTITQREFMNQHWYHCHTCKMVDGVGVCSVCARVCHRGHDVTYAKYGNFFCDCGAKEDGSCIALEKRSRLSTDDFYTQTVASSGLEQQMTNSSQQQNRSSPVNAESGAETVTNHDTHKPANLETFKATLMALVNDSNVIHYLDSFINCLVPAMQGACKSFKTVGSYHRARDALHLLHLIPKKFESADQLMVPTLGSQEGAFENVRMSYSGEQGQSIRQLLSAQLIRRVAMCCMASPHGKRQHLAVSHEKGKITVLQLSALLKQPEASKRKLTLTRLSSAPIPFTVLSITGNPCNEDFLAVCGLKDCHVLTFSSSGSVVDHLVLHPQLEIGNFIIRAIWLPGSQTQLALVTADFVKIYDLSKDAINPQYFFLIPAGKVRDCTFVSSQYLEYNSEGIDHMLLMCSNGHIYDQVMNEESSAVNGHFYVTNTLTLCHPEIGDVVGQIASQGGVSVYYSHCLQMLFWSYANGKSFLAPLRSLYNPVTDILLISVGKQSSNGNKAGNTLPQPLCQWTEVPNHPGLVCSVMQGTNNPVILMLKPMVFLVQEIKVVPAKAKIMDMVVVRHPSSNSDFRTTLILLCEDGSLRIYMAEPETTGYWLSSSVKSIAKVNKTSKKKKVAKVGKPLGSLVFPVDFFEHCEPINMVEFGGNDLLQIYSANQIKHRLNTTGLYVASAKHPGFSIEITNPEPTMMIMGIRVLLGTQEIQKAPTYVEVFGRTVATNVIRSRWYDIPFTREESLQADKKFTVTFGPSTDVEHIIMVDSIKVYGKLKDISNWNDDSDELLAAGSLSKDAATVEQEDTGTDTPLNISCLERLTSEALAATDNFFVLANSAPANIHVPPNFKRILKELVTLLLTLPIQNCVQYNAECLLVTLHASKAAYFNYKDHALLQHVYATLHACMQGNHMSDPKNLDSEDFYQLVMTTRSVAVARPYNLAKFEKNCSFDDGQANKSESNAKMRHFMVRLVASLWCIHSAHPVNMALAPVYVIGLTHVETTVQAIVEIIHAFTTCDPENTVPIAAQLYLELLLCEDTTISFSAKQALLRVLRPRGQVTRIVSTQPHCTVPRGTVEQEQGPQSQESTDEQPTDGDSSDPSAAAANEPSFSASSSSISDGSVETLLNATGNFPALMDIAPDTDDETLVELAIALSLQGMDPSLAQGTSQEGGHYSDTTASAGGSDDEGSTAATDGSTLRTSPAEQMQDTEENEQKAEQEHDTDTDVEEEPTSPKLHLIRLALLEHFVKAIPKLKEVGGVNAIPFMQVVLLLTTDLYCNEERSQRCLQSLLSAVLNDLNVKQVNTFHIAQRTKKKEVHLVFMRLLSVMLFRTKVNGKTTSENMAFISSTTAAALQEYDLINYCLTLLKGLLMYWKSSSPEEGSAISSGSLLKAHPINPPPDMSPFFLRLYVKSHAADVFEAYPQLLTEMVVRLPYQVHKIVPGHTHPSFTAELVHGFSQGWRHFLCEYMMMQQTPFVRRQVRKLLLSICSSKDEYRQLRDIHSLHVHVSRIQRCYSTYRLTPRGSNFQRSLPYDRLVELMEHLKACVEIATSRVGHWQTFCALDKVMVPFLVKACLLLDEGVAPTFLQLLQCLVCDKEILQNAGANNILKQSVSQTSTQPSTSTAAVEKEKHDVSVPESAFQESFCGGFVNSIITGVSKDFLTGFIKTFLLDTNATAVRWQTHALLLGIFKYSLNGEYETLLEIMWSLWPQLPAFGRKAAQYVDLLGYFSLNVEDTHRDLPNYVEEAVNLLQTQNKLLACHPNSNLYTHVAQYVELDGFYLESEPCLVCNNPEVPFTSVKLSTIKIDSKFTTHTQIVKLIGSHTISRITLRISELKRTKMVRTLNIYYNNRTVQAVVELKNKPAMWNKAKKVTLTSGQTETKIDFPLPIVACNLMIEYADFYENIQASSETLQCPRCSASVPANPGVCTNCGENVFQCHKCRAINYDEKDPFLCHACGFCKYAKFDYSLTARSCCAVDKIENDEDRKKTISIINSLLEKADRVYKTISTNKPTLELLLLKICEHRLDRTVEDNVQVGNVGTTQVNRAIQLLAQRYCGECKNSFEELSKIIQRVLACRRELVMYDQCEQVYSEASAEEQLEMEISVKLHQSPVISNCYGCASSATELCLTLLRALASHSESRQILISQGLIAELLDNNLKRGTSQVQEEVRQLLCLLTRDNNCATEDLRQLLMERIGLALRGHKTSAELTFAVRHEMSLLSTLVMKDDACWEQKLRCVMHLFMMACDDSHSPVVMQSIILPCLKMLQSLIKPDQPLSKKNKDKSLDALANISPREGINMVLLKYLQGDSKYSYNVWYSGMPSKLPDPTSRAMNKEEWRELYLIEKYGERWCQRVLKRPEPLHLSEAAWLKNVLFNPCSRLARQVACNMLESLCQVSIRKRTVVDLLTGYLCELSGAGESAAEYLSLYQSLIQQSPWKEYLALRGILVHIASLITQEIEELHRLEATTLTSNLSQGYALKMLTELLYSFLEQDCIKQQYKGRLVGAVLNGYVSIRRLVIQRTRLIDETQDKLLEILEEITTGTEEETRAFMTICIEAVKKYSPSDMRTPVFIFERICSIIYPEDNDTGEFFLTLEKDPQQEDFLQGRMVGNPYVSSEQGLGPLMRDVKNKICQDCELVALLEDDNGMELLVNNKIISLDLPVREVYKKIWVAEGGEGDAMRVVYRMRGLLGDATEEFVETLVAKNEQETNDEEVYKMANVMADCGGLQIMLDRFAAIKETTKSKPLLQVLLKLFKLCLKVKRNQELLTNPDLGTICVLLRVLHLTLRNGCEKNIAEQLLQIMEAILLKAASQSVEDFIKFSASFGGTLHINILLPFTSSPIVVSNSSLLLHLTHVLAALTYCNEERMALLCNHFKQVTDFNKFDAGHTSEDELKLELFCILTTGIERNPIGNTLKDHIISLGIVKRALDYIMMHAPCDKPILVRSDCEKWKDFISKPALKYILRFLTGLAANHPPTQVAVSTNCVPIIHQLEQMSSDEHVGSLAENLLEALRQHPQVATHIEEVREHTRAEKKKLAMAMREKQLGALGMCSNEKGQVTAKSPHMMEDLGEETGLICVICREGYKFQPNKVLGIYTFSKRCNVEEFEVKHRKTLGYTTVTHFNIVHIDCHMSAVRLARSRDEWESAALQNANTRCNGLLPLWGPLVPESAYASCLARHNTYLYESTGHRDINCTSAVHDLKLLLLRFAQEKSFHEDTGGGGPQSNMLLVPYLLHMALYVLNSTRIWSREEECLNSYLSTSHGWVQDCYVAEGPLYWCVMSLLLHSPVRWMGDKLCHLNRILLLAQAHEVQPTGPGTEDRLVDSQVKSFSVYKSYLIFFGLVDQIYKQLFRNCCTTLDKLWPSAVADYIRHNDEAIIKACDKLFHFYTEDLLPCASFDEIFDVLGLRSFIEQEPTAYVQLVLSYGS